jgi:hypothetical protein
VAADGEAAKVGDLLEAQRSRISEYFLHRLLLLLVLPTFFLFLFFFPIILYFHSAVLIDKVLLDTRVLRLGLPMHIVPLLDGPTGQFAGPRPRQLQDAQVRL